VSSRAGYAGPFHRGFRPVGRRALRFIAFLEIGDELLGGIRKLAR
jgi:hypothetical protein